MLISLNRIRLRAEHDIKYFDEYALFNKDNIDQHRSKIELYFKEDAEDNPADVEFLKMLYEDDLVKIPSIFYHSYLISLYSFLEFTLNEICVEVGGSINFPFMLDDLAGKDYLSRARLFLTKVGKVDFDKIDREWMAIRNFQKIRNFIAHNNGTIGDDKAHENMIKSLVGVKFDERTKKFFIVESSLMSDFLKTIHTFLAQIIEQIESNSYEDFAKKPSFYYNSGASDFSSDNLPF